MIWSNRKLNSEEYEKLSKKQIELNNLFEELKTHMEILKTNMNSLRGLVNRKIGKEDDKEDLNNEVILKTDGSTRWSK